MVLILGIYIKNTGCLRFSQVLKNPNVKISIYNEDNGKQIGDSYTTKTGIFNDDFLWVLILFYILIADCFFAAI